MPESAVKIELQSAGLDPNRVANMPSEVEEEVRRIRNHKFVDWVGRLAGYPIGYWVISGKRLLVTSESTMCEPKDNGNHLIEEIITRTFGDGDARLWLLSWAKLAREARKAGIEQLKNGFPPNFRPGQYVAIVGPPDHYKTLLARVLVWTISGLDDTKGDLSQYHKGETTFNADGARHETHVIDDEGGSDNYNDRRKVGEFIKKNVGQQEKRIHGKGADAVVAEFFNRTIILLNEGQSDLRILPELEDGVRDKLSLLATRGKGIVYDTTEIEDYNQLFNNLRAAIPDFIYLLDNFEVPEKFLSEGMRFGIKTFHDQQLCEDLEQLSETTTLFEIIDGRFSWSEEDSRRWSGTAGELFLELDTWGNSGSGGLKSLAKDVRVFGKIVHHARDQHARRPEGEQRIRAIGKKGHKVLFEIRHADDVGSWDKSP